MGGGELSGVRYTMWRTGGCCLVALSLLAVSCGGDSEELGELKDQVAALEEKIDQATTVAPTTTTTQPPTTTAAPTTAAPTTTSEPTWTSDSTWDMCLVTAPAGRRYEWLNHETWMSLERQRREIQRSLMPDGGGATTASAASREAGDHVALIDGFADARCDLIVTIGAEMGEATTASARRHSDVDFIGIDQHHGEELPNLAGLVFTEDRAGFLVGALAASATVTEIVAVVLDSGTEPSSVAYGTGFTNGVAHVDPDVEVLSIVHPGDRGEPDADWGATAAREALDGGADVVFGPGSGSGRGVLVEVAGTGYNARNGALCIGAEVDDWLQVIKARRCLLTSVLKLPNEFHSMYWRPGRPSHIKHYEEALDLPAEYESERSYSTLALINQEFLLGGTPSGGHVGPVGLHFFNLWGAHKTGVPNRTFWPSDDLKSMLADLTGALWTGEVPAS